MPDTTTNTLRKIQELEVYRDNAIAELEKVTDILADGQGSEINYNQGDSYSTMDFCDIIDRHADYYYRKAKILNLRIMQYCSEIEQLLQLIPDITLDVSDQLQNELISEGWVK